MSRIINTILQTIRQILEEVVNILLPKTAKVEMIEKINLTELYERIPAAGELDFETENIKPLFCYRNSLCRQAIWEIKYRASRKIIQNFSLLLYEYILEELYEQKLFNNFKKIILLPIPSSRQSSREKGFNQCTLVARALIKIDRERKQKTFELLENFLIKKINTPHQSKTRNRKERLENLKNTFQVNLHNYTENHSNTLFILIDDVITTGATMNESFRALNEAGIKKILGFCLAH